MGLEFCICIPVEVKQVLGRMNSVLSEWRSFPCSTESVVVYKTNRMKGEGEPSLGSIQGTISENQIEKLSAFSFVLLYPATWRHTPTDAHMLPIKK